MSYRSITSLGVPPFATSATARVVPLARPGVGVSQVRSLDLVGTTPPERLASVGRFVQRLTGLGVVDAARKENRDALVARAAAGVADPVGPCTLFDVGPQADVSRSALRFVETLENAQADYRNAEQGRWRSLWSRGSAPGQDEPAAVGWAMEAQRQRLVTKYGWQHPVPAPDRFVVVSHTQLAGDCLGCVDPRTGLLFIQDGQSDGEFVATAVHEAVHWSSVMRVAQRLPRTAMTVFGLGLGVGELFQGLNEAMTAVETHEVLQYGLARRQYALAKRGRAVLPPEHLTTDTRLHTRHDGSYRVQRQRLDITLAAIYRYYVPGSTVDASRFSLQRDPVAQAIGTYLALAYYRGDPTFYAMGYHALGDARFGDLARDGMS